MNEHEIIIKNDNIILYDEYVYELLYILIMCVNTIKSENIDDVYDNYTSNTKKISIIR